MRAHVKKKLFRLMVKEMVKQGKINTPDGHWGNGIDNSMKANMLAGHRVGGK